MIAIMDNNDFCMKCPHGKTVSARVVLAFPQRRNYRRLMLSSLHSGEKSKNITSGSCGATRVRLTLSHLGDYWTQEGVRFLVWKLADKSIRWCPQLVVS